MIDSRKTELQMRLVEMGHGNLHGPKGLPGVQKRFGGKTISTGQETQDAKVPKLLLPANRPKKPTIPSRRTIQGLKQSHSISHLRTIDDRQTNVMNKRSGSAIKISPRASVMRSGSVFSRGD